MKTCSLLAVLCFTLFAASPVAAQSPAPAPTLPAASENTKVDPALEADIRKLMDLTGSANLGQQMVKQVMAAMEAQIHKNYPANPRADQYLHAFYQKLLERFTDSALIDRIVPVYARYLTDEDIRGMIAFYQTPVGQKVIRVLPQISHDALLTGIQWGSEIVQSVEGELAKEFPEIKLEGRGAAN